MSKTKTPLDELAKLLKNPSHHLSVDVYNEDVKVIKEPGVKKHKHKYTLNQIGDMVVEIKSDVNSLKQDVQGLKQDIKDINARLDYIVDANNLKDSK